MTSAIFYSGCSVSSGSSSSDSGISDSLMNGSSLIISYCIFFSTSYLYSESGFYLNKKERVPYGVFWWLYGSLGRVAVVASYNLVSSILDLSLGLGISHLDFDVLHELHVYLLSMWSHLLVVSGLNNLGYSPGRVTFLYFNWVWMKKKVHL